MGTIIIACPNCSYEAELEIVFLIRDNRSEYKCANCNNSFPSTVFMQIIERLRDLCDILEVVHKFQDASSTGWKIEIMISD